MGSCLSSKNKAESTTFQDTKSYPKFSYFNPEAELKIKFKSPTEITSQKIPTVKFRLPINGLSTKLIGHQYIIVGGFDLWQKRQVEYTYYVDFQDYQVLKQPSLDFVPFGGSLYYYRERVYLVGCQRKKIKVYDSDQDLQQLQGQQDYIGNEDKQSDLQNSRIIPFPFKTDESVVQTPKKEENLTPSKLLQFNINLERWMEIEIAEDMFLNQGQGVPDQIYDPGTALCNGKIYFIAGYYLENGQIVPNKDIVQFDLERRTIYYCSIQFNFGLLKTPKCVGIDRKNIMVVGGIDQEGNVSNSVYKFFIDKNIKEVCKFDMVSQFTDGYTAVGKYGFGVIFQYPKCYLFKPAHNRIEEYCISVTSGVQQLQY